MRARNPSHFGSKTHSPAVGNSATRLASIGRTGGFTGSCIANLIHHSRQMARRQFRVQTLGISDRSLRSRWKHKAWGVSPRKGGPKVCEPVKTGDSAFTFARCNARPLSRARTIHYFYLGLTPQALCFHPLRGLPLQLPESN